MAKDGPIDHDLIRGLAALLSETDLSEIEIEQGGLRVRVARNLAAAAPVAVPAAAPALPKAADAPSDPAKAPGAVLSPMVGTAYLAPEPGAKPFVEIGTQVRQGQTVLIIEAMKTM